MTGYIILIDTREQRPLSWPNCAAQRATLRTGDYSIVWAGNDLRDVVAVERKSVPDLLGCVGRSRARFERELARLAVLPYRAMVVEGTLGDLLENSLSEIHPHARLGSVMAWSLRFGVPPIFANNRTLAAAVIRSLLVNAARLSRARGISDTPLNRRVKGNE